MTSFKELNIITPILEALNKEGYTTPTSIQAQAIPHILKKKDVLGCAQTGTGKTAAFAIPTLQILNEQKKESKASGKIKALILTPTRELAGQIGESFSTYGRNLDLKHLVIYGGVSQHSQTAALKKGVDILIATPGRLKDLMNQGFIKLNEVGIFILDEADRMLDMGFIHDIKMIITKLPAHKQSLFFTATLSLEIKKLASTILVDPEKVEVAAVSSTAEKVSQSVYYVEKQKKRSLLLHLLKDDAIREVLVFTRTKHGADRLAMDLKKSGIKTDAIHGGKTQNARQRALNDFKTKKIRVLVATDVAARGIDIDKLSHVINYELPNEPETYVHRIGRTGRAGESGSALSFCDHEEKAYLRQINKLTSQSIPVVSDHPYFVEIKMEVEQRAASSTKKKRSGPNQNNKWMSKRRTSQQRRAY